MMPVLTDVKTDTTKLCNQVEEILRRVEIIERLLDVKELEGRTAKLEEAVYSQDGLTIQQRLREIRERVEEKPYYK